MIKKILIYLLTIPCLAFAQGDGAGGPDQSPIISISYPFIQKLDRTSPFIALEPGSVSQIQNMKRIAPGVPAGWTCRNGMTKHNTTTALNSGEDVKSLHQYVNKDFGTRCFIAQVDNGSSGDLLYNSIDDPPDPGTEFASSSVYTLSASADPAFSGHINDDWVGAAGSASPWAWSGGTAYPDGFVVVQGGTPPVAPTINNDDFEDNTGNDPADWTDNNATAQTVTSSPTPHGDSRAVEITVGTADANTSGIYQSVSVTPGVQYSFSAFAYPDAASTYLTITNDDFESGPASGTPTGWVDGAIESSEVYDGTYSASTGGGILRSGYITCSASTDYILEFAYNGVVAYVQTRYYNSSNTFVGFDTHNPPSSGDWVKTGVSFTTPATAAKIAIYFTSSWGSALYVDDVEIYESTGNPSIVIEEYSSVPALVATRFSDSFGLVQGQWTEISGSGTAGPSASTFRIYLGCNGDVGNNVYFDDISVLTSVDVTKSKTEDGYDEVRNSSTSTYAGFLKNATDKAYVGFRRRIDSIYLYLGSIVNAVSSSATVEVMRGGSWTSVSGLSDGTSSGGVSLAQSGALSWTYSANDEPYLMPGVDDHLYWYRIGVNADITDGITVYECTVADDCQTMTSLSDGIWASPDSVVSDLNGTYSDQTTNLTDDDHSTSWANVSWATNESLYIGSVEKIFALYIDIYDTPNATEAAGDVIVKYYDASTNTWTSITPILDGTNDQTYSFAYTGIVQWDGSGFEESQTILVDVDEGVASYVPMYWYELSVSDTSKAEIFEIATMRKPSHISEYNGVVGYHSRALWWPGTGGGSYSDAYSGGFDYSADGMPHVFVGTDAGTTGSIFGDGKVNCIVPFGAGAIVSTQNPYSLYALSGYTPADYQASIISSSTGCVAPKTMLFIGGGIRLFSRDTVANAIIFMAPDGFYLTDGESVVNISSPISDYFDTGTAPYIEPAYINNSYAWVDFEEKTVHFAVPINTSGTGTQSTLNRELVYAYVSNEWYDLYYRSSPASCGINLIGSSYRLMPYIGDYSGYVWRTDYGKLDGSSEIDHYIVTSPISPLQSVKGDFLNYQTDLRGIKLKAGADTTAGSEAKITAYADGNTTGVSVGDMSLVRSGYTYVSDYLSVNSGTSGTPMTGDEFSFKFDNESVASSVMKLYGFTIDFQMRRPTY